MYSEQNMLASWYLTLGSKGKKGCVEKSFVPAEHDTHLILTLIIAIRNLLPCSYEASWKVLQSGHKAETLVLSLFCAASVVPPSAAGYLQGPTAQVPTPSASLRAGPRNVCFLHALNFALVKSCAGSKCVQLRPKWQVLSQLPYRPRPLPGFI